MVPNFLYAKLPVVSLDTHRDILTDRHYLLGTVKLHNKVFVSVMVVQLVVRINPLH